MSNTSRVIPLTCSGHTRPVVDLHFSALVSQGNYYLISACKDGKPMLRNGVTGDWLGTFKGHKGAVWSARLSKGATKAVTSSADSTVKLWTTHSGQEFHSLEHTDIVRAAEFDQDETKVATGGKERMIRIFDLYRPHSAAMEIKGHEGTIRALVWDEARHTILSAGEDAKVRIWDLRTMRERGAIETKGPVSSLSLSSDGQYVGWAAGHTANFWKPDGALVDVKTIETKENTSSVSLHPTHHMFVAGSDDDLWVRIYDFNTAKVKETYKGHHGPIHTVSYSPDGELYATGSEDGTIRLWQTNPNKPYGLWQKAIET